MIEELEEEPEFKKYWQTVEYEIGKKKGKLMYPEEYFHFDDAQYGIDPDETIEERLRGICKYSR